MQHQTRFNNHIPVCLTSTTSLGMALYLIRETHGMALPVIDNGCFKGVVFRDDLLLYAPSPATTLSKWELPDLLRETSVETENLIKQVPTLPYGSQLDVALRTMQEQQCPLIAIVEDGCLFQLITWQDVLNRVDRLAMADASTG